jgi:bifunctional DNA-binding transcriptional regulator/antitoxin component of YhaV-PrlF toxin-antitoxin module
MPRKVKIQSMPNGQFMITIPKALAEAMGIRGGEMAEWSVQGGRLVLEWG